ncbi:MAG: DUF3293 domain-containing protein [Actinomycetota bacterium]|nr:DUF3293 domain-containing protein [Actinomycetota bacterium]
MVLAREDLFAEYEAAIVSACDPNASNELAWSDPALFCALRGQAGLVLTAWNPGFARPTLAINEAKNQQMLAAIQAKGFEIWPAECASPDGQFREPGFLVWAMPVELGARLAAEFEQLAIYAYSDDGERSIVACGPA